MGLSSFHIKPGRLGRRSLSAFRLSRGYQPAVRAFGSTWFLLLGLLVLKGISARFPLHDLPRLGVHGWADLASRSFIAAYWFVLWVLLLLRPAPVAHSGRVLPSAMALLGTYLPLSVPALAPGTRFISLQIASSVLLLVGGALTIVVLLHLGRSFSLLPQARRLISHGPYRLIRHPLYVAEEISLCGVVLHFFSAWTVALLFVHCAIQIKRMLYEESVLMRTFPAYRSYAASTARIIPGYW
jgi:protein-S-isoprenylcysteine O-methyltransferase Ste14